MDSDRRSTVVWVHKIMKSLSRAAKMMHDISFTVNPALTSSLTWFLGSFELRIITKCKRFVTIN